jgi:hypothetical protein
LDDGEGEVFAHGNWAPSQKKIDMKPDKSLKDMDMAVTVGGRAERRR